MQNNKVNDTGIILINQFSSVQSLSHVRLFETPWSYDQPREHIKKQRQYFVNKCLSSQGYGFSSGHVWTWELDYKESWMPKNWYFWTEMLEKTFESPLGCKEIRPVHPKGDKFWVFIARTDVEAEASILWPPDVKNWLMWKDPDAGKDWGEEEKGMTEDEMVGWHHWLSRHGFWWTLGVSDGQGGNNYLKRKWVECPNQKTKTGWMDTKTRLLYFLSTRDPSK